MLLGVILFFSSVRRIPVHRKEPIIMFHHKFLKVLGKAFQYYAGLALMVFLFQLVGLIVPDGSQDLQARP